MIINYETETRSAHEILNCLKDGEYALFDNWSGELVLVLKSRNNLILIQRDKPIDIYSKDCNMSTVVEAHRLDEFLKFGYMSEIELNLNKGE